MFFQKNKEQALLDVEIVTPSGTTFHDRVRALSSINEEGPFDLLPRHSRFISIIKEKLVLHLAEDKGQKEFTFDEAVLKNFDDKVKVFLGV